MATTKPREARASAKFVRMSPYKVRYVLALIRGKHVDEARRVLQFTTKAPGRELAKILNAAVANAENTLNVPALGRAYRIRKRTSHITIVVQPKEGVGGSEN